MMSTLQYAGCHAMLDEDCNKTRERDFQLRKSVLLRKISISLAELSDWLEKVMHCALTNHVLFYQPIKTSHKLTNLNFLRLARAAWFRFLF